MTPIEDDDPIPGKFNMTHWRGILRHARPYRGSLAGLALAGLLVALCDIFLPRVTGAIIDNAVGGSGDRVALYAAAYLGLIGLLVVTIWFFIVLAGVVATGISHDLRREAFARLQDLSFSYYDQRPVGWLMARLTTDCDRIASVLPWTLLDAVWGFFLLSGVSAMMLWMNWKLALAVLCIVPMLAAATGVYQRQLIRTQRMARRTNSQITASFNEGITGVRTTKAFVLEADNLGSFQRLTGELFRHSVDNALYAAVYLPIVMTLGAVGLGLALWKGGLSTVTGAMPFGDLIVFMQYAALFHIPVQELAQRFTGVQAAQVSAERLHGLLEADIEIKDSQAVAAAVARFRSAPVPGLALDGRPARIREVAFEDVDFKYASGNPVLAGFNLKTNPGECIALVGETGSGKSTVAKLLCRFYEPSGGRILFDGVDYRDRSLEWIQSILGIVLQEPHLFSGTIRENIRYGRLAAADAEIEAVARQVGASGFIEAMPEGYATEVGEGGNRLSTGQKQLVALARALLADPQILVLDEATSSVDNESERRIQEGIQVLLKGRLSLIIAHRLSTIRSADRILMLEQGRVVDEGSHSELLRKQGPYARLYSRQFHGTR